MTYPRVDIDTSWDTHREFTGKLETPPTNLPSVSKLQHRRVSFRYFEQHSHGVHIMVRGLHLCQFYECNASRPDISLTKKKSKGNLSNFNDYKRQKLVGHYMISYVCFSEFDSWKNHT